MDIHSFTSNFKGGGARQNLFQVQITNPVDASLDSIIPFRVKAATLPKWSTNELEQKFMGRSTFWSGVRTVDAWTVTVIEDSDMKVRNALESWQNWLNLQKANVRGFGVETDDVYKTVGIVDQLDKLNNVARQYTLFGLWLQDLAAIQVDWDNDGIISYDATFRYDYFEVSGGYSGNASDKTGSFI